MKSSEKKSGAAPDRELDWKRLGARRGQPLPLFDVRLDRMQHPAGDREMERLVLESVDWVNVVAFEASGTDSAAPDQRSMIMVRQYRFGVGYATLETPGGMVDPGEDSLRAAKRELLEETGFGGGSWHYLGAVEPNPAFHDNLCHHWLARDVRLQRAPQPGNGEAIRVERMSEAEVKSAVGSGEIKHVLALSALGRVLDLWPQPEASG
jgi:8-oxo-dGTP pyrophosphatase MutT (NUDIX family)